MTVRFNRRTVWVQRFIVAGLFVVSTASAAFAQTLANDAAKRTDFSLIDGIDFAKANSARGAIRESDSLLNGALIGAAVAIGSGLFVCTRMEPWANCRDDIGPMIRIGAIGAGVGITIDALIRGRKTRANAQAPAHINVAPIATRRAKGVQMSFSF